MSETLYLRHGRLHYFVREVLKRLRLPAPQASRVGDVLVASDLAGVEGEGVRRLPYFATRISTGLINPSPKIEVVRREQATATIDGDNGMGHLVAIRSMELALSMAATHGIAAVAARHSNDLGMAGYYARMALEERMVGIVMSNAPPALLPTYGVEPALGANPMAIAIPAGEDEAPIVLDMATSATSRPRLEDAVLRRESIPRDLALDANGRPTEDPRVALDAMRLLPLGGRPETSSHKGYGLALALDALCGVLAGGSFGRHLAESDGTRPTVTDLGHFVLALRVESFAPWVEYRNRIKVMLGELTRTPAREAPRVYYPGEPELEIEGERRANGIPIDAATASELEALSRRLDIHDVWEHLVEGKK